jgi:methylthioribose-1-phosphate isomerase
MFSEGTVRELIKQLPAILASVALIVTAWNSSIKSDVIREQAEQIVEDTQSLEDKRETITNLVEQVKSIATLNNEDREAFQ